MKLVTHKPDKPVLGHVNLKELNQRFKSLGLNQVQITGMLTDPVVSAGFFSGKVMIVVRDCNCCGDKTVFAAWKQPKCST